MGCGNVGGCGGLGWGMGGHEGVWGGRGGGCGVNWGCGGYGVGGCGTPLIPPLLPPQFADIMQKIEDYIARQPRAAEGNGGGGDLRGGVWGRFGANCPHFGSFRGCVWGLFVSRCSLGSFGVVLCLFWVGVSLWGCFGALFLGRFGVFLGL